MGGGEDRSQRARRKVCRRAGEAAPFACACKHWVGRAHGRRWASWTLGKGNGNRPCSSIVVNSLKLVCKVRLTKRTSRSAEVGRPGSPRKTHTPRPLGQWMQDLCIYPMKAQALQGSARSSIPSEIYENMSELSGPILDLPARPPLHPCRHGILFPLAPTPQGASAWRRRSRGGNGLFQDSTSCPRHIGRRV